MSSPGFHGYDWTIDSLRTAVLELLQEMTQTELSILSPLPQMYIVSMAILNSVCIMSSPGFHGYDWTIDSLRTAVLELLQEMTQTELSILSPLPQSMISNLINSKYNATLSDKTLQSFGEWYTQYRQNRPAQHSIDRTPNSRLTFHVVHEVPKLRAWFTVNHNPSDRQLQEYVNELNSGYVRIERPKVNVENLRNWFKNERQKLKRKSNH
ncbi:DNA-binding protein satb2 [Mactra antiquata]